MAGFIFYRLTRLGFTQKESYALIEALQYYVKAHGIRWKDVLQSHWRRAYYPYATPMQANVLQAIRNIPQGMEFILSLSPARIRSEAIPSKENEPLWKKAMRGVYPY